MPSPGRGLYYNRFRYYDPGSGEYVSQDPIGLQGGQCLYAYVRDTFISHDPLGLAGSCGDEKIIVLGEGMDRVRTAVLDLRGQGKNAKWYQAWERTSQRAVR